jgi:serine/threonine protein kinase
MQVRGTFFSPLSIGQGALMHLFAAAVDRRARRLPDAALTNSRNYASSLFGQNGGPWQLTRLIGDPSRFLLCRARRAGELGPGCYVLKRIRPGRAAAELQRAALRREATLAAALDHPQIVSVLAADIHGATPYLVLPYLEGTSLQRLVAARARDSAGQGGGRLPLHFALALTRQIASPLAALHSAGWLHGQVSPRHILLSPQGQATLIDLTQARQVASPEARSEAAATPAHPYAAPELFRPGVLTAAADIYALGATLFEMLTGEPPFASCAGRELADAHRTRRPPDLRRLQPGATLEAGELLSRMLAKEPLRRPTAEQLVAWLAELEIDELTRGAN